MALLAACAAVPASVQPPPSAIGGVFSTIAHACMAAQVGDDLVHREGGADIHGPRRTEPPAGG